MNLVIMQGRLTKEPELSQTNNGKTVCNFGIAVKREYKDQTGNYPVDFFNCEAYGTTATYITTYLHKGDGVCITGSGRIDSYVNNNNQKVNAFKIHVDKAEGSMGRSNGQQNGNYQQQGYNQQPQYNVPAPQAAPQQGYNQQPQYNNAPQQAPAQQPYNPQPQQAYGSAPAPQQPQYNNAPAPQAAPQQGYNQQPQYNNAPQQPLAPNDFGTYDEFGDSEVPF